MLLVQNKMQESEKRSDEMTQEIQMLKDQNSLLKAQKGKAPILLKNDYVQVQDRFIYPSLS